MAKGKKSFILYTDLVYTFEHLTREQRGDCIWWVLQYVDDRNPENLPGLLQAVVEPLKHQLKRDLKKYEDRAQRSRENGALGGRPSKKKPSGLQGNPKKPRKPDTVNDTVNVNVNDTVNDNDSVIKEESEIKISSPTKSFKKWTLEDFKKEILKNKKNYTDDLLSAFGLYWSEENDKGKMRFQLNTTWSTSGRLATWQRNDEKFGVKKQTNGKPMNGYDKAIEEVKQGIL